MGAAGAAKIVFRRRIQEAEDKAATEKKLVEQYKERFYNPYLAASHGYIDDIIEPSETRGHLIRALEVTSQKRDRNPGKKHGNIPL